MTSLPLHVVREDAHTFTLGWEPVGGVVIYVFTDGEGRRSHTRDVKRTSVPFYKGRSPYTVQALVVGAQGSFWEHA